MPLKSLDIKAAKDVAKPFIEGNISTMDLLDVCIPEIHY